MIRILKKADGREVLQMLVMSHGVFGGRIVPGKGTWVDVRIVEEDVSPGLVSAEIQAVNSPCKSAIGFNGQYVKMLIKHSEGSPRWNEGDVFYHELLPELKFVIVKVRPVTAARPGFLLSEYTVVILDNINSYLPESLFKKSKTVILYDSRNAVQDKKEAEVTISDKIVEFVKDGPWYGRLIVEHSAPNGNVSSALFKPNEIIYNKLYPSIFYRIISAGINHTYPNGVVMNYIISGVKGCIDPDLLEEGEMCMKEESQEIQFGRFILDRLKDEKGVDHWYNCFLKRKKTET